MINQYPTPTTVTIDYAHDLTHKGKYFSGAYYTASVASVASIDVLIQISSTSTLHALISVTAGGDATVELYEGTTFSSAGTAVTMSNHNRASATAFAGTVTYGPTVTVVGTQINGTGYIPGGSKHTIAGGGFDFGSEFILAKSTNYLIRVTNTSGSAAKMSIALEGYMPTL